MNQITRIEQPDTSAHAEAEVRNDAPESSRKRKSLFAGFGACLLVIAAGIYAYDDLVASRHEVTDNAYVGADVALITPLVGGSVYEVLVTDTQPVKKDDVLVRLDDIDAQLTVTRAEATLSAAEAQLEKAKIDLARRRALSNSGSVSGDELTAARNAYHSAEAALKSARAVHDQARIDLQRTVIRAPMDGVISKRQVQVGQRVQPGMALMTVVPINAAYVDANFKETQLAKVRVGQSVTLHSDLYGKEVVYSGRVVGFSGGTGAAFAIVPTQNATGNWIKVVQRLPVRIALDPKELKQNPLRVGLSMTADIRFEE